MHGVGLEKKSHDSSPLLLHTGGQDKLLRIWDLRSGQLLQQLRPFTQHVIKNGATTCLFRVCRTVRALSLTMPYSAVAFGDDWKLARGDVVGRTFLPALILPSLDWFSFPGG
jgi:WD40 repeat protein